MLWRWNLIQRRPLTNAKIQSLLYSIFWVGAQSPWCLNLWMNAKRFHESDEKKLQEFFIGLFTPKSGIFWVQPVRDTKLKCAQTSKRTIPCKGINTPRFLAEYANIPVGIYLLKVSNRNIRTRCKILTIVNFEHVIAGWDKKMFKVHENASLTIFLRKELC